MLLCRLLYRTHVSIGSRVKGDINGFFVSGREERKKTKEIMSRMVGSRSPSAVVRPLSPVMSLSPLRSPPATGSPCRVAGAGLAVHNGPGIPVESGHCDRSPNPSETAGANRLVSGVGDRGGSREADESGTAPTVPPPPSIQRQEWTPPLRLQHQPEEPSEQPHVRRGRGTRLQLSNSRVSMKKGVGGAKCTAAWRWRSSRSGWLPRTSYREPGRPRMTRYTGDFTSGCFQEGSLLHRSAAKSTMALPPSPDRRRGSW